MGALPIHLHHKSSPINTRYHSSNFYLSLMMPQSLGLTRKSGSYAKAFYWMRSVYCWTIVSVLGCARMCCRGFKMTKLRHFAFVFARWLRLSILMCFVSPSCGY
uniref:Uncharacterized protein n=1 Tax=Providencia rettgeri TaxID=587 RepID=Q8RKX3_PRORE|nr:hypothetical protein [Providencia rettgeri]